MNWFKKQIHMGTALIALASAAVPGLAAPNFSIGVQESSHYCEAQILSSPQPEIPSQVQEEGLSSYCVARFVIQPDGTSAVKLLKSSGNLDADDIALKTLQQWRFKPATLDGKPLQSTRKVRIEFEIN